ncbi:DUF3954 domain-containing protein [Gracilibacillus saliphilus]|uniref:DUF3954 domain-containing protein n=1 Tax=Gracilibacillus saliphilus TaxID=543890 RepID=UPI0013D29825|nr:DUF3954 domain-containing protein [Gracilibacillus saliphilus]
MAKIQVEIDTSEDAVIVVVDGELKKLSPPPSGHGKNEVIWKDNKIFKAYNGETVYFSRK